MVHEKFRVPCTQGSGRIEGRHMMLELECITFQTEKRGVHPFHFDGRYTFPSLRAGVGELISTQFDKK
eukprot:scaffold867_cov317-Pavlova_lutheri.AAC.71